MYVCGVARCEQPSDESVRALAPCRLNALRRYKPASKQCHTRSLARTDLSHIALSLPSACNGSHICGQVRYSRPVGRDEKASSLAHTARSVLRTASRKMEVHWTTDSTCLRYSMSLSDSGERVQCCGG